MAVPWVAVLWVVAGCSESLAAAQPAPKAKPAKGKPAAAAPAAAETPAAAPPVQLDLSLVSPKFYSATILHPARLFGSPLVAPALKDPKVAARIKKLGVDLETIQRIVWLSPIPPAAPAQPGAVVDPLEGFAAVISFAIPVNAKEATASVVKGLMPEFTGKLTEKKIGEKTCLQIDPSLPLLVCAIDEKTLVVSGEKLLGEMLAAGGKPSPLKQQLGQVNLDADLISVTVMEPVRGTIKSSFEAAKAQLPPQVGQSLQALEKLKTLTFSVDLKGGPTLLTVVMEAATSTAAKEIKDMATAAIQAGKTAVTGMKRNIPPAAQAEMGPQFALAETAIAGLAVAQEASKVTVALKTPEGLGAAIPKVVSQLVASMPEQLEWTPPELRNLKAVGAALYQYAATVGGFPPPAISDDQGRPLLSWRVAILPQLGYEKLFEAFKLDEPWDSPHNKNALNHMPDVFAASGQPNNGTTSMMVFVGQGTPFGSAAGVKFTEFIDGMPNTVMLVEAGPDKAVPWTKPEDLPFNPNNPAAALGAISGDGIRVIFCDGKAKMLPKTMEAGAFKRLITHAGSEF
jgi:hypothetical protein